MHPLMSIVVSFYLEYPVITMHDISRDYVEGPPLHFKKALMSNYIDFF